MRRACLRKFYIELAIEQQRFFNGKVRCNLLYNKFISLIALIFCKRFLEKYCWALEKLDFLMFSCSDQFRLIDLVEPLHCPKHGNCRVSKNKTPA